MPEGASRRSQQVAIALVLTALAVLLAMRSVERPSSSSSSSSSSFPVAGAFVPPTSDAPPSEPSVHPPPAPAVGEVVRQGAPEQILADDRVLIDPWQGLTIRPPRRTGWVVFDRRKSERRGRLELAKATDWRRTLTVLADYPGGTELESVIRARWGPGEPERCVHETWSGRPAVSCSGESAKSAHREVTAVRRDDQVIRLVVDVEEPDAPTEGVRGLVELEHEGVAARRPSRIADATGPDWRVRGGRFTSDAYGLTAMAGGPWTLDVDPPLDGAVHGIVSLHARDPDITVTVSPVAPGELEAEWTVDVGPARAMLSEVPATHGRARLIGRLVGGRRVLGLQVGFWKTDRKRAMARLVDGLQRLAPTAGPGQVGETTLTPSVGPSYRLDGRGFRDHGLSILWARPNSTLWRVRRVDSPGSSEVLRFSHARLSTTASLHASHVAFEDGELLHDSTVASLFGEDAGGETTGVVFGGLGAWETVVDDGGGATHVITALSGGLAWSLLVRRPATQALDTAADALSQLMGGFRLGHSMRQFEITATEVRDPLLGYAFELPEGWSPDRCQRRPGIGVECRDGRSEISVTVTALGDPFVGLDDAFDTMEAGFRRFLEARNLETLGSERGEVAGRPARHLRWRPGGGLEAHEYRVARDRTLYGISIVAEKRGEAERLRRGFRLLP